MPVGQLEAAPEAPPARQGRRSIPELVILPRVHATITVLLDVVSASVSVALAQYLETSTTPESSSTAGWMAWLFVPLLIALLAHRGLYRPRLLRNFLDEIHPVESSVALAACALLMPLLLSTDKAVVGEFVLRCWLCAAVLVPAVRLLRSVVQRSLRRRYRAAMPTLIIGDGPIAHQLMHHLQELPEYGMRPIGLLDDPSSAAGDGMPDVIRVDVPWVGSPADLEEVALKTGATDLIVSFCPLPDSMLISAVRDAHRLGMRVWVIPRLFDAVGSRAHVEHVGGLPLMAMHDVNPRGWQFAIKHAMDRTVAALALLLVSPVFLTLALLVRLSSPGPIFFAQQRVGRDGKPFDCLKFRSMRPPRASDRQFELRAGSAPGGVEGVDRRTRIGKLMRQTSLDELPQLINVLKGEMSLVGPRPERPEFVELFEMQIRRYGERHRVKAGVTGWAQVHGLRGQTSIASRAEWDNYYIENWSLWLDLKILALTVLAVLRRAED